MKIAAARQWQDAGGTHVTVVTGGLGLRTVEELTYRLAEVEQRLGDVRQA